MDFQEILNVIFQVVGIPLLTALTGIAIKWINSKANEIKAKTNDECTQKYVDMLNNTITTAVTAINQTYVNELKDKNVFDKEAQQKAFAQVYNTVTNLLTEEAHTYLNSAIGDLETYITNKIEEEVLKAHITTKLIKKEAE